jgi:hypothetical protein
MSEEFVKTFDSMKSLLFINVFVLTLVSTVSAQVRSGTYYRSDENGKGDITFREVNRGKSRVLNFEVLIAGATRGTCVGDMKGKAKWIDTNVAEYENSPEAAENPICRLTFIFSKNRVLVREDDGCKFYHGAACQFEGTYEKRASSSGKRKSK